MTDKKQNNISGFKVFLIVFLCIVINFIGKSFADMYSLPMWMDAFGTVYSAYVLGLVCGAVVGATNNIVYSFWNPMSLAYGITSVAIGILVGIASRKNYFSTLFRAMSLAGNITIVSVGISTALNLNFYAGNTGNLWGDGVRDFLIEKGVIRIIACIIGELYLDFLDKLVTIMAMFIMIRICKHIKIHKNNKIYDRM